MNHTIGSSVSLSDFLGRSSTTGSTGGGPSSKQQQIAEKVRALESELKKKLASNFNSVRKAWLELDEKHIGYITAEEIANVLGASNRKKFDFTLLEILVKLHSTNLSARLYYKDFCSWLGNVIEPTEAFYFRHDSQKNP